MFSLQLSKVFTFCIYKLDLIQLTEEYTVNTLWARYCMYSMDSEYEYTTGEI